MTVCGGLCVEGCARVKGGRGGSGAVGKKGVKKGGGSGIGTGARLGFFNHGGVFELAGLACGTDLDQL